MTVDVGTKLTLDDSASRVLDGIQRGFEETNRAVETSQSAIRDFGIQFAATFAATNLKPLLQDMASVASEFISVGSAAYDSEQGIAGMLAGMTGTEWGVAREYAESLNDEFNDLSVNIGQLKSDIQEGHRAMTTFLGGTSHAMKVASDNMENLTVIANVQGISVRDLGSQFGKMASGFISMESPVFNLLRSTGIFSNDISKINKEWQELTQAERINILESSFAKIAKNLSTAPPTLSDMQTSMAAIADEFKEAFGKSAMKEFMGPLDELRGDLRDSRGDMQSLAQEFGKDIGAFAREGIASMRDGFKYIKTHSEEIRSAIKSGFEYARETISWIIEHKTELMAIGGAFAISQTGMGGALIGRGMGVLGGVAGFGAAVVGGGLGKLGERSSEAAIARYAAADRRLQPMLGKQASAAVPKIPKPEFKVPPIKVPPPIVKMPPIPAIATTGALGTTSAMQAGSRMMPDPNVTKALLQQDSAMRRAASTMTAAQRDVIRQMSASRSALSKLSGSLQTFAATGGAGVQTGSKLAGMIGKLFSTIAGGGPAVWAATAAVAGLSAGAVLLVNHLEEAEKQRQETIKTNLSEYAEITGTLGRLTEGQLKQLDKLRSAASKAGADSGVRTFEEFDKLDKQRRELLKMYVTPMEEAKAAVERASRIVAEEGESVSSSMLAKFAEGEKTIALGIDTMFTRAHKAHNEAVEKYMLTTLNSSKDLKTSFLMASEMTAEGFAHLADVASTMGDDFAQLTSQLRSRQERAINEAIVQATPQVNFNGGQVFKIQQNFRDQDPDRIVVSFQRRITQAAVSRVQAVTTTPFGT